MSTEAKTAQQPAETRDDIIRAYKNIISLFESVGYKFNDDGTISRNQFRDCDINSVIATLQNALLGMEALPNYGEVKIRKAIKSKQAELIQKSEDKMFADLKYNSSVVITDEALKQYLGLYLQWTDDIEYNYFKNIFCHWLLSVKRRFYHKPENNPLCLIFNGKPSDGKSRLINDICDLLGKESLSINHFEELFKDNRAFQVWTSRFILAVHEWGIVGEKYRETFKDYIDAKFNSGRKMNGNNMTKGEIVASLIGATNNSPREVLQYDPNNRKIVFLQFIHLTPTNRDLVHDQRDAHRKNNFLKSLFISLNEDASDCFDDDKYYQSYLSWLKPRNAEHTLAEKYHDCLIKLFSGQKIAAGSWYEGFKWFHAQLSKTDDDGKKMSPLAQPKFKQTFGQFYEYGRTKTARYYIVPTVEQANNRGYCYFEPDEDWFDDKLSSGLIDNIDVISDADIAKSIILGEDVE